MPFRGMGVSKIYMINRSESEVRDMFERVGLGVELFSFRPSPRQLRWRHRLLLVARYRISPRKKKGEILARGIVDVFLAKEQKGFVLEMCYHPNPRTYFFNRCEEMGWDMQFGTEALIW